jgi:hypothetical protein
MLRVPRVCTDKFGAILASWIIVLTMFGSEVYGRERSGDMVIISLH